MNAKNLNIIQLMQEIGQKAKVAALALANCNAEVKNSALRLAATSLRNNTTKILAANKLDMEAGKSKGLDKSLLDRLELTEKRIEAIASSLEEIALLPDPVGKTLAKWDRPSGLNISRVSVPLGVIGIIYESRPNVTADAGALCLKSGNAAILRGGSESFNSSKAIESCLHEGLKKAGITQDAILLVPVQDREAVGAMLAMPEYIDVIIPRGGKGLCKRVMEESRVPTLLHLDGNCHTYIHAQADKAMAVKVVSNAKMRRTGICGATESLVIDAEVAAQTLPAIVDMLADEGCEIRGDELSCKIDKRIIPANDADWDTEYLDAIISVKIVAGLKEAIDFINRHSSHHTDAIITSDNKAAEEFLNRIDSAIVMHNTSTQFADGGEFGMGAEIGIATGRLHARGPVGVEQLTTYKYVVKSDGSIRPR